MEKKKPIKKIRIGKVGAAIWVNSTEHGDFYNVTFERTYFEGKVARSTNSFGLDDLPLQQIVNGMAFDWIIEQTTKSS